MPVVKQLLIVVTMLGAAIAGNYGAGAVTSLKSPIIDHMGVGRPKLSFQYYIDTTLDVEGGQLRFLTEAGEKLLTRQEIFSGKIEAWTFFCLTIPCEGRNHKIVIEFCFLSDGEDDGLAGWYIDDVVVDR